MPRAPLSALLAHPPGKVAGHGRPAVRAVLLDHLLQDLVLRSCPRLLAHAELAILEARSILHVAVIVVVLVIILRGALNAQDGTHIECGCDRKGLRIAEVLHGGRNPNPSVESSGAMAPIVAGILRDRGTHYASRVDVAIDRAGPTLFREWRALCERLSMQYRLAMRVIEAPTDPDAGSTVYLGSRKSEVFLRVYEKGLKTAHDEGLAQIPDEYRHWVRAEIEFKPDKKAAKHAAALMEPDVFWGITEWLAHFALEAFAMRAEPVNLRERRLSDHDRAMRWMADQYRSHLDRLWRDHGRDDAAAFRALRELAGIGALSEAA